MRKIAPQDVRDDFKSQLAELSSFHITGLSTFTSSKDQSTLTERTLLSAAVAWEGFVSDLFIAYINTDATRFKQHMQDSFDAHLKTHDKAERIFSRFGTLTFPAHLSKADVQSLANGNGNNITFPNFHELEERASKWLVKAHADRFKGLSKADKALVNAVIALRNHIAHRSDRSGTAMNELLAVGVLHSTGIKRAANKVQNVGAWLKAIPPTKAIPRIDSLITALDVIGAAC